MNERIFAAIDGGTITNTFVANDDFIAMIRSQHDEIVEITTVDPRPSVQWTVHPDGYRPPSPYPSWVWSEDCWVAPISKPNDGDPWMWDEETRDWIPFPTPAE